MNPTRGLIHRTSSSAKRERCIIRIDAAEANSIAKSRSETASSELRQTPSNPSVRATCEPPLLVAKVAALEPEPPVEPARFDVAPDLLHSPLDRREVFAAQNARVVEHFGVRERPFDVEKRETLVETNGSGVALDEIRDRLGKARRPRLELSIERARSRCRPRGLPEGFCHMMGEKAVKVPDRISIPAGPGAPHEKRKYRAGTVQGRG